MAENKNDKNNCENLWRSGAGFDLLRWVLGIAALAIVFAVGVKVGEFKGFFRAGSGDYGGGFCGRHMPMMGGYGGYGPYDDYYGNSYGYYPNMGPGMMRYGGYAATTTPRK